MYEGVAPHCAVPPLSGAVGIASNVTVLPLIERTIALCFALSVLGLVQPAPAAAAPATKQPPAATTTGGATTGGATTGGTEKSGGTATVAVFELDGLMTESLMAAVAASDPETRARLAAFLDMKMNKVRVGS